MRSILPNAKHLVCLGLLVLAAVSSRLAHAGEDEVRACDFKVKARCVSGGVRVTLAAGVVKRLEVDVFWCGLRGRPGYGCTIDSTRGEQDANWSDEGGATVVTSAEPWNPDRPDRVKVTVGHSVSIDMEEAQSLGACGFGAELPKAIVIPAQGGACRVWLNDH